MPESADERQVVLDHRQGRRSHLVPWWHPRGRDQTRAHRPHPRRVKVQFVCERLAEIAPDSRPMVGMDLGISARVALSTGETIPGVKLDRRELKRHQRRLSKAQRGSRNRQKRKAELAREWQRVREREKGALHELTADLVKRVAASWTVEDLQTKNMMRNRAWPGPLVNSSGAPSRRCWHTRLKVPVAC